MFSSCFLHLALRLISDLIYILKVPLTLLVGHEWKQAGEQAL